MGIAIGLPGQIPRSHTVKLGKPSDRRGTVAGNLIHNLDEEFRIEKPMLLFKEQPFTLGATGKRGMSYQSVRFTYALHGVIEAVCARWGVPCREAADSTIRKHFIGKGRLGDRDATKRAVISRCIQLGYMPAGCRDDNRADALAGWDYAAAMFGGKPGALHLFGEGEAA